MQLTNKSRVAERYLGSVLIVAGICTMLILVSSFFVVIQNEQNGPSVLSNDTQGSVPRFSDYIDQPSVFVTEEVYGVRPTFVSLDVDLVDVPSVQQNNVLWQEQRTAALRSFSPLTAAETQLLTKLYSDVLTINLPAQEASALTHINKTARPFTHRLFNEVFADFEMHVMQLRAELDIARPFQAYAHLQNVSLGASVNQPTPSTPSLELAKANLAGMLLSDFDVSVANEYKAALAQVSEVTVKAGLQYPVDATLSQQVAERYFMELNTSDGYQLLLQAAKNEW